MGLFLSYMKKEVHLFLTFIKRIIFELRLNQPENMAYEELNPGLLVGLNQMHCFRNEIILKNFCFLTYSRYILYILIKYFMQSFFLILHHFGYFN